MASEKPLTGVERFFNEEEVIVSKTDLKGRITYANRVFLRLADYSEAEIIGAPHSIIRHPGMPRCIFKFLWQTIQSRNELFAYVVNRSRNGDHYWVYAHVTPSYDRSGAIVGYHSNRRVPDRRVLDQVIIPTYRALLDEERRHADRAEGLAASMALLTKTIQATGMSYDEWIFSL